MTLADQANTAVGRRSILGAAVAAAMLAIGMGSATGAAADPVDLTVIDRDAGQTLGIWNYGGRQFIAGRPGARYALRLSNTTSQRVLAVVSVDGVNILTGETANPNQRGYILRPYESYEVSGWRKSESTIAAFTFTALSSSYAAQTGRPSDVGVIGMAVFNERRPPPPPPRPAVSAPPPAAPIPLASNPAPQAGRGGGQGARATLQLMDGQRQAPPMTGNATVTNIAGAPAVGSPVQRLEREQLLRSGESNLRDALSALPRVTESLGTGHGALETSFITILPFERATAAPYFVRQIEYDSHANLMARGVIPAPPPARPAPRPFPGAGFVPDPPRY